MATERARQDRNLEGATACEHGSIYCPDCDDADDGGVVAKTCSCDCHVGYGPHPDPCYCTVSDEVLSGWLSADTDGPVVPQRST